MSNRRLVGIDLLKILACIGVIGLHSFSNDDYQRLVYFCFTYAIPIFYMCSGYLLLNKNIDKKYIFSKIRKILLFYIIWEVLYQIIFYIKEILLDNRNLNIFYLFNNIIYNLPLGLLQKGNSSVFWYLGALLIIYLYAYYINKTKNKDKVIKYVWYISVIISSFLQLFSYVKSFFIQQNIIQTFRIWTILNYSNLGYVLKEKKKTNSIILLIAFFFTILYQYEIAKNMNNYHAEYFYDDIIIVSLIILIWNRMINSNNTKHNDFIAKMSKLTIGVYPIHIIILETIQKFALPDTTIFIMTIVISFFLSFLLNENKYLSFLVKL